MITASLEQTLQQAYAHARELRHELIGLEHLLLALLDNADARKVLLGCHADMAVLAERLQQSIEEQTPIVPVHLWHKVDTQPTLGFQRVLQRAMIHAQSADKAEVNGADVRLKVLQQFLAQQGLI